MEADPADGWYLEHLTIPTCTLMHQTVQESGIGGDLEQRGFET